MQAVYKWNAIIVQVGYNQCKSGIQSVNEWDEVNKQVGNSQSPSEIQIVYTSGIQLIYKQYAVSMQAGHTHCTTRMKSAYKDDAISAQVGYSQ